MDADSMVAPLRRDVYSGAAELTRRAVSLFESVIRDSEAEDVESLRADLAALAGRVLQAQPSMAPLVALATAAVRAASGTASLAEARAETARVVTGFRERLEYATREVAARAEGLIPAGGRVLTLSASSTVRAALLEAAKRRAFDVVCLEGRPHCEGRAMAAALADAGIGVTLAVDAATAAVIRRCDVVLIGADSVGDLGVVNKLGTRPAALAARSAGVPIYALADTSKILPTGFPQPVDDDRPGDEVWPDAPAGVMVWNRYFEATPLPLLAGVVTEQGLRSAAELEQMRTAIDVPAELRARVPAS